MLNISLCTHVWGRGGGRTDSIPGCLVQEQSCKSAKYLLRTFLYLVFSQRQKSRPVLPATRERSSIKNLIRYLIRIRYTCHHYMIYLTPTMQSKFIKFFKLCFYSNQMSKMYVIDVKCMLCQNLSISNMYLIGL